MSSFRAFLLFLCIAHPALVRAVETFAGTAEAAPGVKSSFETNGAFQIVVTDAGTFTGTLRNGGTIHRLKGTLTAGSSGTIPIQRKDRAPLQLSFTLATSPLGDQRLDGSLSITTAMGQAPFSIITADEADKTTSAVTYTTAIRPSSTADTFPRGDGIGWLKRDTAGRVTYVGHLADGTAFTSASVVAKAKTTILFASLYKNRGSFGSRVEFDNKTNSDVKSLACWWFRPFISGSLLPHGWPEGLTPELIGARYAVPVGESLFAGLDAVPHPNGSLKFSNGGLPSSISKPLYLAKTNTISKVESRDSSYSVKFVASTGSITGTFTHSSGSKTPFKSILLQKGNNRRAFGFFVSPTLAGEAELNYDLLAQPTVVITEIMAKNAGSIADEDDANSDWIELYNPGATPVDLTGWSLTDDDLLLTKWQFPATTILAPKSYLIVWASSKNRQTPGQPLHTNFNLGSDGEYLALVRPDGLTIEQEFDPYPALATDESFGVNFVGATLASQGSTTKFLVPSNNNLGTAWTAPAFADGSWYSGKTGLGFGVSTPGMTVRIVGARDSFGDVSTLAEAVTLANLPTGHANILQEDLRIRPRLNLLGEGSDGHYDNNEPVPLKVPERYAVKATGLISIPRAGDYVFGLNSDDGGRIRIDDNDVMVDDSNHGPEDHLSGPVTLTAGFHSFEVIMWEGGGGDEVEFYAAPGNSSAWDPSFKLVGGPGGLEVFTPPLPNSTASGGLIGTNVQNLMLNQNASCYLRLPFTASEISTLSGLTLNVRHQDGFIAYLNGTEVARRNAPALTSFDSSATAQRSVTEGLLPESLDLSDHLPLLVNGRNVLAIHAMNDSASERSFLILPELYGTGILRSSTAVKFGPTTGGLSATPGSANGIPLFAGSVEDTTFSVKRGYFTTPFSISIRTATPAAQIRYTLDGSTPSATRGLIYKGPIKISRSTIVRAMATKPGFQPTNVDTQTYLFPADVMRQQPTGAKPGPGWPADRFNGHRLNYGMDPAVVNSKNPEIGTNAKLAEALTALPSLSIVTDLPNLFDLNNGIYVNPYGRGVAWERPASVELLGDTSTPDGGFQINCGLRVRGGASRSPDNPKHGFRLFFRNQYGDGQLLYPIFGSGGASIFKRLDIRTAQNYSWSFGGDGNNTFIREELTRELQGAMGQAHSRSRYVHLYLNGVYWGLFDIEERTEAFFGQSYLGGNELDYDVVKSEQDSGYITGPTDGDLTAWTDFWNKSLAHSTDPTNERYFAMQGLAADGTTPTADPVLLDTDNLIDYMLLTFWTGNLDGCTSAFLGETKANNWSGARNRLGLSGGFKFFAHDFEHSFFHPDEDRTGPFSTGDLIDSNPMWIHHHLRPNLEYRMRWADRVQQHLFNGGALDAAGIVARVNARKAQLDTAIIAESARWGDSQRLASETPFTRLDWLNAVRYLTDDYLPVRSSRVIEQLRADGLYPATDAPSLSQFGGSIALDTEVVITGNGGTLHFTLDGTDPRQIGGTVSPAAQVYTSSSNVENLILLSHSWKFLADGSNQGTNWRSSSFDDSTWSSGPAELGYGDSDETTAVPFVDTDPGTGGDQRNATTYFRSSFTVSSVAELTTASIRLKYDDAAIIYINGTEAVRTSNIDSDPAHDQFASGASPDENALFDFSFSPTLLVEGSNTIAVEIHQAAPDSTDISFQLALSVSRTSTPTPIILSSPGSHRLKVRAKNGDDWSALVDATFDVQPAPNLALAMTAPSSFTIGASHAYTFTVSNSGSAASTSPAEITCALPEGLTATGASGSGWTIVSQTARFLRARHDDPIAPGNSLPNLMLNFTVGSFIPLSITTSATVSGGGDSSPANNTDSLTTPVTGSGGTQRFIWGSDLAPFTPSRVNEEDGSVTVTLHRQGYTASDVSVLVSTIADTATSPDDYEAIAGQTVTFTSGQTSQTITVNIQSDSLNEGHHGFFLRLSDPVGASIVVADERVTILDPDSVSPTVVVTSPGSNARVFLPDGANLLVPCIARDNFGIARVEGSINGSAFVPGDTFVSITPRPENFAVRLPTRPGLNSVSIRAIDLRGNVSAIVTRPFTVVSAIPLEISSSPSIEAGSVKVTPPLPAPGMIERGKSTTLTPQPAVGFRFDHWITPSGIVQSTSLPVSITSATTIQAVFVPNPFVPAILGSYNGLLTHVAPTPSSNASNGALSLIPSATGSFTGKLKLDGQTLSLLGQFKNDGSSSLTLTRRDQTSLRIDLQLDLNPAGSKTLTASVTLLGRDAQTLLASGTCERALTIPVPPTSFDITGTSPSQPNSSTGKLSLSAKGIATLVLQLSDGTRLTTTAPIGASGKAPFHANLYLNRGSFQAPAQVIPAPAPGNPVTPTARWFRPIQPNTEFPLGWPEGITVILSR